MLVENSFIQRELGSNEVLLKNCCYSSECYFSDDGSVRVWRNIEGDNYSDKSLEMVTAWQALSGMLPSTRGMTTVRRMNFVANKIFTSRFQTRPANIRVNTKLYAYTFNCF